MDTDKIRGIMQFYAQISTVNLKQLNEGRKLKSYQRFALLGTMMAQGFIMLAEVMVELFNVMPATDDVKM